MKMAEALAIIDGKPKGFMVSFEQKDGDVSLYIPTHKGYVK